MQLKNVLIFKDYLVLLPFSSPRMVRDSNIGLSSLQCSKFDHETDLGNISKLITNEDLEKINVVIRIYF